MKYLSEAVIRGKLSEVLPFLLEGVTLKTNANRRGTTVGNIAGEVLCVHENVYFTVGCLPKGDENDWCAALRENGRPERWYSTGCHLCQFTHPKNKSIVVRPYNATRVYFSNTKAWFEIDIAPHLKLLKKLC